MAGSCKAVHAIGGGMKFQFKLRALFILIAYYAVLSAIGVRAVIYGTSFLVWALILWLIWRSGEGTRQARRAALTFEHGDYEQSILAYTSLLETMPRSPEAYLGRGSAYFHSGDLNRAVDDWREALRLRPTYAEAHANLGHAWLWNADFTQAVAHLAEAVCLNPRLTFGQYNLGCARLFQHDFAGAVDCFRAYLTNDRRDFEESFLASTHNDVIDPRWAGWVRNSITAATAVLEHDPNLTAAYLARAIGEIHFKENDRVLADCTSSLELLSDDALALYLRSFAHRELGHEAEAAADLELAHKFACRPAVSVVQ